MSKLCNDDGNISYDSEFENGVIKEAGTFYLFGGISEESCYAASQFIVSSNLQCKHKSLCLVINSRGGDVEAALALIAIIKTSAIPVFSVAIGNCSSAGLFIAMACTRRVVDTNCSILSHQYSGESGHGKHVDLMASLVNFEMLADKIVSHYVQCTGRDTKYIKKHLVADRDIFLSANDAIKHGCFDALFSSQPEILYHSPLIQQPQPPRQITLNG